MWGQTWSSSAPSRLRSTNTPTGSCWFTFGTLEFKAASKVKYNLTSTPCPIPPSVRREFILLPRVSSPLPLAGLPALPFTLYGTVSPVRWAASSFLLPFPPPLAGAGAEGGRERADPVCRRNSGMREAQEEMQLDPEEVRDDVAKTRRRGGLTFCWWPDCRLFSASASFSPGEGRPRLSRPSRRPLQPLKGEKNPNLEPQLYCFCLNRPRLRQHIQQTWLGWDSRRRELVRSRSLMVVTVTVWLGWSYCTDSVVLTIASSRSSSSSSADKSSSDKSNKRTEACRCCRCVHVFISPSASCLSFSIFTYSLCRWKQSKETH